MIAGMVLSNLLYVFGAIVVATVVSAVVLLRHRRPRSLESGIEMFSRELKALQPERPGNRLPTAGGSGRATAPDGPSRPSGPGPDDLRGRAGAGAVVRLGAPGPVDDRDGQGHVPPRSDGAGAPSPEQEAEPG